MRIGRIGLVIKEELKKELARQAKEERRTQTAVLEQALTNYFKHRKALK